MVETAVPPEPSNATTAVAAALLNVVLHCGFPNSCTTPAPYGLRAGSLCLSLAVKEDRRTQSGTQEHLKHGRSDGLVIIG